MSVFEIARVDCIFPTPNVTRGTVASLIISNTDTLKVVSCSNDDNSVQIFYLSFSM